MSKPLPSHEWLKLVVESKVKEGCSEFKVVRRRRYVLLLSYTAGDKTFSVEDVLHTVKRVGSCEAQEERLERNLGQYRHWLQWVKLSLAKAGTDIKIRGLV